VEVAGGWGFDANDQAFDKLIASVTAQILECRPTDSLLAVGACLKCAAPVSFLAEGDRFSGKSPVVPTTPDGGISSLDAFTKRAPANCRGCLTPLSVDCLTDAYYVRVPFVPSCAFVSTKKAPFALNDRADWHAFRPPGTWVNLGKNPPVLNVIAHFRRSFHPMRNAQALLEGARRGRGRIATAVTPEYAIVTVLDPHDAPKEKKAVSGMCAEMGLRAPFLITFSWPDKENPAFEAYGLSNEWRELATQRNVGLAHVFSEPAFRERVAQIARLYGAAVFLDSKGIVHAESVTPGIQFKVDVLLVGAVQYGLTPDEVLFVKVFGKLKPQNSPLAMEAWPIQAHGGQRGR
jgi:hypothetical protein